jgi:autotransporter-associated beta strand protein
MTGNGLLNKTGSGVLSLATLNTFSGGFNLLEGGVKPLNSGALGAGSFVSSADTVVDLTDLTELESDVDIGGILRIKI